MTGTALTSWNDPARQATAHSDAQQDPDLALARVHCADTSRTLPQPEDAPLHCHPPPDAAAAGKQTRSLQHARRFVGATD
jgi:hypothetical protein